MRTQLVEKFFSFIMFQPANIPLNCKFSILDSSTDLMVEKTNDDQDPLEDAELSLDDDEDSAGVPDQVWQEDETMTEPESESDLHYLDAALESSQEDLYTMTEVVGR